MGSRFPRRMSTATDTGRRIIILPLAATFMILGTGAVVSDAGTFNGVLDGAAIALSNSPVAQPTKLATELYSSMRNGTIIKFTEASNGVAAMISEDKEGQEGTEVSEGSEISKPSETAKTIESTEQSTSTEAGESTEQSTSTEAGESTEQSTEGPETSEVSEGSGDTSPGLSR